MPHSAHTSRESPTLPLFIRTPLGAMKIPLPTTVPMMKDTAGSRPISLRRCTTSSSVFSFLSPSSFVMCVPSISLPLWIPPSPHTTTFRLFEFAQFEVSIALNLKLLPLFFWSPFDCCATTKQQLYPFHFSYWCFPPKNSTQQSPLRFSVTRLDIHLQHVSERA